MARRFIQGAIKRPGALSKKLGVPEGKNIPEKKLQKATHAPDLKGQEARFAENVLKPAARKRKGK